jgi:type I restriction-modification system DNA methylase subunit
VTRYQQEVSKAGDRLIARIVLPGEWFLVRWGGTRKGSGTFYTRPQLAIPTTRRTLQPLAYQGELPKLPEEILALKVCDPAMGSGSFPVAALRFLTDALYESLHYHNRIEAHGDKTLCRLAEGGGTNSLLEETLPFCRMRMILRNG